MPFSNADQNLLKPALRPLFYVVDWLPPDFGAVGQYALIASKQLAAAGREVFLIGLTRNASSEETCRFPETGGVLTIKKLHTRPYEKARYARRLLWTFATNGRLLWTVMRHRASYRADITLTGAPPFMLYFAVALKYLRRARLTYRITDFYPEVIIAHLGRDTFLLRLLLRLTWLLRKRIDHFEALGEDQRELLLKGGIQPEQVDVRRDTAPIAITGHETPAARPPSLAGHKVLLYSGNYGVAHEVETVADGLVRHHRAGAQRFGLWLNATGQNADLIESRLKDQGIPVARTAPVELKDFPALLAAADAHLITLRPEFSGYVFPSKVYGCILSGRPIIFVGPASSDVHLLCSKAEQRYVRIEPGDAAAFARTLDTLGSD